jgi:hypothetical protein
MKKIVLAAFVLGVTVGEASAMNYLGAPATNLRAGQWALGGSYFNSKQDVELTDTTTDVTLDDLEQNIGLVRVAVGIVTDRFEVFGMGGVTDLDDDNGFDTDAEAVGGAGIRVTFTKGDRLDWGVVAQFTWLSAEDSGVIAGIPQSFDLNAQEVTIGLGPCWRPEPFIVYGGPYVQWLAGDMDTSVSGDLDVDLESKLGGYFGAGIELTGLTLTAEVQATPDALGWGVGGQWRF